MAEDTAPIAARRSRLSGCLRTLLGAAALGAVAYAGFTVANRPPSPVPVDIAPSSLKPVGSVSDRFLSYNVEMVEVTGGRFWRPYRDGKRKGDDRYEYRTPLNLAEPRLVKLAAALAPAYVRFSGTWANATYFDADGSRQGKPPQGFDTVLTGDQWRAAIAFARATDAQIVTSFATSAGTRDAKGVWRPDEAARLIAFTKAEGAEIAAAEFANEPETVELTQAPKGYTPADYRRDYGTFHDWLKSASPATRILAPGAAELGPVTQFLRKWASGYTVFAPDQLIAPGQHRPDGVSFHFYGGGSQRCGEIPVLGFGRKDALTERWLGLIDKPIQTVSALRDTVAPGAPLWLTETGETACGGNPWAATFADVFRFTDQLARSARQGVQVYIHNTLAASDYGLLDETTLAPRPNYWAAWLWHRLMGTKVLDAGKGTTGLNVYAHCLKGTPGGVALLAINLDAAQGRTLQLASDAEVYAIRQGADPGQVALNGRPLGLGPDDALPDATPRPFKAGSLHLDPASVTFVAVPAAANTACR